MSVTFNDRIRDHINSCGSKIVRVVAVSKTGEVKRFTFNPYAQGGKLSDFVTLPGLQAAATRKANNPDLFNVWDFSHQRWRCFDLSRVLTVKCGTERAFRYYRGNVAA